MTVKEYITSKLSGFGIKVSDADILEISFLIDPDEVLTESNRDTVLKAIALHVLPHLLLRAKSVSENGFSIGWDMDALLKYYAWLCNYLGIEDELNTISTITDISDHW